jgi:hypothetical protein
MGWLQGWNYRKSHVINPASDAETNYQVRIIAHYGSGTDSGEDVYLNEHCRTDFGDVRFTKSDGETLLDYWMESKVNGNNAVFWVEVADDLSTNPVTIYIYYGKSNATTTSNGDNTFIFFDDFFGTTLDPSKWIVREGEVTVENGVLHLAGTTGTRGLIDGKISFPPNKALHVKGHSNTSTFTYCHFCSMRKSNDWNNRAGDMYGASATANAISYETWLAGSYTVTRNIAISTPTSEHIYKVTWKAGQSRGYQDDVLKVTHTTNIPTVDMVVMFQEGSVTGQDFFVDWVFVRKWVDPEPSHGSWGSEETILEYHITGVVRDQNGNPIPNATVWLFRTIDKQFIDETTTNENGEYDFIVRDTTTQYFIRAHKDGTPNIFGTTDRNLTGEEI